MKQGAIVNRIVMGLLFLAILLYLGGAAWRGFWNPYPTVQAYAYELDDTVETTGWLVRSEQVLTGSGSGIVRLTPAEGEKVNRGATVALLYADAEALERSERLEALRNEEAQMEAALAATDDDSAAQGDLSGRAVVDAMVNLRTAVEGGDFTRLESQTSSFKSAVYQQARRNGDADALTAALSSTRSEIDALRAQTVESVGRVTVDESGIFSGQVDGYETVLLPSEVESLTPDDLDNLEERGLAVGENALAKLITDSTWYFVFPLSGSDAARLTVGGTVTVRFSRDWAGEVDMKVERIGADLQGRSAVVLSSNRYLSDTTLLRRQTVELVFARQVGIRVPTGALRVETEERTDPETGAVTEEKVNCVYVKVGVTAERKPVTILAQGEDFYLVKPLLAEDATLSQQRKALRAGDGVVLASGEIWDGKVLE